MLSIQYFRTLSFIIVANFNALRFLTLLRVGWLCPVVANILVISYVTPITGMVRRSVLVYDLLRTEQPPDGFSQKEILTHISEKHDIAAGKTLQRDIAVALRRGLDFGILVKRRNKFRFHAKALTNNSREKSTSKILI